MAYENLVQMLRSKATMDIRKTYLSEAADAIETLERRCIKKIPLVGKKVRILKELRTNGNELFTTGEILEVVDMRLIMEPNGAQLHTISLRDIENPKRRINLMDYAQLGETAEFEVI